jgi:acyl carrier protein
MSSNEADEAALRIANFITNSLGYEGPAADLVGSQPVRLTEAVDSLRLLELAAFVEDEFRVQIQDDEIMPENFGTVPDLVRLLCKKGALAGLPVSDESAREQSQS